MIQPSNLTPKYLSNKNKNMNACIQMFNRAFFLRAENWE